MRRDPLLPRTWLLLGVLLLALGAWALALAGLGDHIHPSQAAAAQRLPQPAAAAAERLASLDQYAGIAAHPPFAPDRQPHPFRLPGQEVAMDSGLFFDHALTGVLIVPGLRLAILQPVGRPEASVRVRVGESLPFAPGWRLRSLEPRLAVFEGPEGTRELALRVFGMQGQGTASAQAASAPDAMAPMHDAIAPGGPLPGLPPGSGRIPEPASAAGTPGRAASAAPDDARIKSVRERIQERRRQMRQKSAAGTGAPAPEPSRE